MKNFTEKINFIYQNICDEDIEILRDYFIDKNKIDINRSYKENRKKNVARWLKDGIVPKISNFKKEFNKYRISQLKIEGELLFKFDDFLSLDLVEFEKKVIKYQKNYSQNNNQLEIKGKYQYIYIYNLNSEESCKINFYEIIYNEEIQKDVFNIKLIPPQSKNLQIEDYRGVLRIKGHNVIINVENSSDYATFIFNVSYMIEHIGYIYGVVSGFEDKHNKLPVSKKVLLSKKRLSDADKNKIYFSINEVEIINTDENLYFYALDDITLQDKKDYKIELLKKYIQEYTQKYTKKLKNTSSFFQELMTKFEFIADNYYLNLAFKEFHAVFRLFEKVEANNDFYVSNKFRALIKFFEIIVKSKNITDSFIIFPILNDKDNIFLQLSKEAENFKKLLYKTTNDKSKKIKLILVIDNLKRIDKNFRDELNKMVRNGLDIKITLLNYIENLVGSYHFFYTNLEDFVIAHYPKNDNKKFIISQQKDKIIDHITMYRKIEQKSITYNDNGDYEKNLIKLIDIKDSVLNKLCTTWYHYFYGSRFENGNIKFWENMLKINADKSVKYFIENKVQSDIGRLEIRDKQSFIIIEDIENKNISLIKFDNIIREIFLVYMIDKQYSLEFDMFSIGLFSKKKIKKEDAKKILGDVQNTRLLEKDEINDRLINYLIKDFDYYSSYKKIH